MIAYEYISTADNVTLMRTAVDLTTPEGIADAVALSGGTFVQSEDGETWVPCDSESLAVIEQARLQQVATDYATPLQQFQEAWAETGVEAVPESWDDALTLLGQSGAGADVFCKLLALRFGALAPVWDDVLTLMNGGA